MVQCFCKRFQDFGVWDIGVCGSSVGVWLVCGVLELEFGVWELKFGVWDLGFGSKVWDLAESKLRIDCTT